MRIDALVRLMLFGLIVALAGLLLLSPLFILSLAWKSRKFQARQSAGRLQKILYRAALLAALTSALGYLGNWGWRACSLYSIALPFVVLLGIERLMFVGRFLSAAAVVCFLFGRGPYRLAVLLATVWVMLQIWIHGGIIHWA